MNKTIFVSTRLELEMTAIKPWSNKWLKMEEAAPA
jgi:hypothetical protein